MADDWRVMVDLGDEERGLALLDLLRDSKLEQEVRGRLGDRVSVTRDGQHVFLYADTASQAREAEQVVRASLAAEADSAHVSVQRWHPLEQSWEDAAVPLPSSDAERLVERERLDEQESAESQASGNAEWEVRLELPSHERTREVAELLEGQGVPVVRRWTHLFAGAANRDDARSLAERLRRELTDAQIEVQPGGEMVWEVAPLNPFAVFGGMGS